MRRICKYCLRRFASIVDAIPLVQTFVGVPRLHPSRISVQFCNDLAQKNSSNLLCMHAQWTIPTLKYIYAFILALCVKKINPRLQCFLELVIQSGPTHSQLALWNKSCRPILATPVEWLHDHSSPWTLQYSHHSTTNSPTRDKCSWQCPIIHQTHAHVPCHVPIGPTCHACPTCPHI